VCSWKLFVPILREDVVVTSFDWSFSLMSNFLGSSAFSG
jgi:hypothetical protein